MIDLTPLDVRNKRGDFKKLMRGYDPQEVDVFLELVAERLEILVRENMLLRERTEALQQQVASWSGREKAVQEALVTAQELRSEMKTQAQRQADFVMTEAQAEARRQLAEVEAEIRTRYREAERKLDQAQDALEEVERRRHRFLRAFRQLLEREMDVVAVEDGRAPLEERPIDLNLGGGRSPESDPGLPDAQDDVPPPPDASVDELAGRYRSEGHDLFSAGPQTKKDDEDARWG
ncbi:MAG: DivIVA domain-containing protein [Longimicrobiales bacterium]